MADDQNKALAKWQRRLAFLQESLAELSDPAQKFTVGEQIAEAEEKICELSRPALPANQERSPEAERLAKLYAKKKELTRTGADTTAVASDILDIRRQLKRGPLLNPGDHLGDGRFELFETIGKGGFAEVWRAWDNERQQQVALKVLHGQHSKDESRRDRFFRGARKMAELQHPNIVRVLGAEHQDDVWFFFVMEFVEGGDFEKAVKAGQLSLRQKREALQQVGEALTFAHEKGVVHRDVKPSNILLTKDGTAKLTDFDLVKAGDTTGMTQTQATLGTLQFAAPEALESAAAADERTDIYSFASTIVFVLLDGALPATYYRGADRVIDRMATDVCSTELRQVLVKATAFEAGERYSTLKAFCSAFVDSWPNPGQPAPSAPQVNEPSIEEVDEEVDPLEDLFRWVDTVDGRVPLWRDIPAGGFLMGSPLGTGDLDEKPQHEVTIKSPFQMMAVAVTNAHYNAFDPSKADRDYPNHPVVDVSWNDAMKFCEWLSKTFEWAKGARLPTEEEWEYAARATTQTKYWSGDTEADLDRVGWYGGNSDLLRQAVGQKAANAWGLYDVHGNVWEWTLSEWANDYESRRHGVEHAPVVLSAAAAAASASGDGRVCRGGDFGLSAVWARVAHRNRNHPETKFDNLGFRVVLPVAPSLAIDP